MYTAIHNLISWRYYSPLVTLLFLSVNVAAGYIIVPDSTTTPLELRKLGAALGFPIISGFCIFFLPILGRKAEKAIMACAQNSKSSLKSAKVYGHQVRRVPRASIGVAVLLGPVLAISYMSFENLLYIEHFSVIANAMRVPLIIQAIYFYVAMTLFISSLLRVTVLVSRFATQVLNIELFHIEELSPLADSVLWNTISISILLSLSPLFWLARVPPKLDMALVLVVFLVTLYLLLYPIFQVRNIVLKKKQLALARIRDAFKVAVRSDDNHKRRLTDSAQRMEDINNLVGVRNEISSTKEWPISLPVSIRIALVVIIPPLSWAGASLVEWAVLQVVP